MGVRLPPALTNDASLSAGEGKHGTDAISKQKGCARCHTRPRPSALRVVSVFQPVTCASTAPAQFELSKMASAEAITVLLRVRPCTQADAPTCLTAADDGVRVGDENFQFSHVFDQAASQEDVFEHAGRCVVETTLRGFNSTVMAYGQTGSGKTHTLGTAQGCDPGLIQNTLSALFTSGAQQLLSVEASFVEIYQERVKDLLAPAGEGAHEKLASFSKATKQKVASCEQALSVLAEGAGRRTVGATLMNCASSRSHAVFALELEISAQDGRRFTPKLLFVDLAGSE